MCPEAESNEKNIDSYNSFFKRKQLLPQNRLTAEQMYDLALDYARGNQAYTDEENQEYAIYWCKSAYHAGCNNALAFLFNALLLGGAVGDAKCIKKNIQLWEAIGKEFEQYSYLGRRFAHVFFEPSNYGQVLIKAALKPDIDKAIYYLRLALHDDLEIAEEAYEILKKGLLQGAWSFPRDTAKFHEILAAEKNAIERIEASKQLKLQAEEVNLSRLCL